MKGTSVQMKGRREDMNAHWNENEKNVKGKWMDMNTNERNMKGKQKDMTAQWKEDACKWKENEGTCMQMHATRKEHEVLPKHRKPTKQLLNPFPSLFRNGFWWFWLQKLDLENAKTPQNPVSKGGPQQRYGHNNSNYSDVDFDGSSHEFTSYHKTCIPDIVLLIYQTNT